MFLSVQKCEREKISPLKPKAGEILQSVLLCDLKNKDPYFFSLSGSSLGGHACRGGGALARFEAAV